jgi:hypothetical protein
VAFNHKRDNKPSMFLCSASSSRGHQGASGTKAGLLFAYVRAYERY